MKLRFSFFLLLVFSLAQFGCGSGQNGYKDLDNPADPGSQYPYLYSTGNQVYMSWLSKEGSKSTLNYARYDGENWSSAQTIASDSNWFLNWADFPSIIADDNSPIAAHWLNKKPGGTYSYDVNISTMDQNGKWSAVLTPHNDSTATEHGFASMIPWDENTILAVWLDGRNTADRAADEYYNINYAMTLRGALISRNGEILKRFLIDDAVCDCCQTSLTKTEAGAVVAYRNRTDEEIRDIYTSSFNGEQWSQPSAVSKDNWKIGACPVNGPKVVSAGSKVAVAWYTGSDDSTKVQLATSANNGETFSNPLLLNDNKALGRVDAVITKGTTYVSWMENIDGKGVLKLASVKNQERTHALTVGHVNQSRRSGVPQMEKVKNRLIFAWTEVDSTNKGVKTKELILPLN